jgi:hypothetical protein
MAGHHHDMQANMHKAMKHIHEHHKGDHHHEHAHGKHHSKPGGGGKEPTDRPGVGKLAKEGK